MSWSAIANVNDVGSGTSAVTLRSQTLSAPVNVGDIIIVNVTRAATTDDSASDTMGDSLGNVYGFGGYGIDSTTHQMYMMWYSQVTHAGTPTINWHLPSHNTVAMQAIAFRSSVGTPTFDSASVRSTPQAVTTAADATTTPALVPANDNELAVATFVNTSLASSSFPTSTTVVDNFNRASLGATWANTNGAGLQILNSTVLASLGGGGSLCAARFESNYGPNFDTYITYSAAGAADFQINLFSISTGFGYFIYRQGTTTTLHTWNGTTDTVIGTATVTWGAGDKIGTRILNGTVEVWRQPSGGAWGSIISVANSAYQYTDYRYLIGTFSNSVMQFDDFVIANTSATSYAHFTPGTGWTSDVDMEVTTQGYAAIEHKFLGSGTSGVSQTGTATSSLASSVGSGLILFSEPSSGGSGGGNLVTNPDFEIAANGTAPWVAFNGSTLSRYTTAPLAGTGSLQVVTSGTVANSGTYNGRFIALPNTIYLYTFKVKGTSGIVLTGEIDFWDGSGGFINNPSLNITLNGATQNFSMLFSTPSNLAQLTVIVKQVSIGATTFYVDDFSVVAQQSTVASRGLMGVGA